MQTRKTLPFGSPSPSSDPAFSIPYTGGLPGWVFGVAEPLPPSPTATEPSSLILTIADAAAELRVSQRTVRRLIARGRIEAVRIGRSVRIPRAAIAQLLRDGGASQFNSIEQYRD